MLKDKFIKSLAAKQCNQLTEQARMSYHWFIRLVLGLLFDFITCYITHKEDFFQ